MSHDLEVRDASAIAPLVHKHGCAIWRGLAPDRITTPINEAVLANILKGKAYTARKGGVLSSFILSNEVREARATPEIRASFRAILGGEGLIVDDGTVRSGIYLSEPKADLFHTSHPWHQDMGGEFPDYAACVWVALIDGCGVAAPGVSFVARNPGRQISGEELDEAVTIGPIVTPLLNAGDAVFFDSYSIHATHRTPEMTKIRGAFKLMATRLDANDNQNWPPNTLICRV